MNYLYKTSRILYVFTGLLVFAIIFCLLLTPASSKIKRASSKPAVSKPPLSNTQEIFEQSESIKTSGKIIYGKSGLGVNLICEKISPDVSVKAKILMTFEIHGYEDQYPKDGQVLVDIGSFVANYFAANRNLLNKCELYIVASANPDGLAHGITNNGVGRCQVSLGVNINRDFPYDFKIITNSRDHTLDKPFAAPESRGLRDLVASLKPDVVIDCHGWEDSFIGDKGLAACFENSMPMYGYNLYNFTSINNGYFSAWASTQGAKAMLFEYPPEATKNIGVYANGTIAGLKNLINNMSQ
jgi:protein MpaA